MKVQPVSAGIFGATTTSEVFEFEDRFTDGVRNLGIDIFEFAADHVMNDFVELGAGHFAVRDCFAVPQNGVAVGDALTLLEEMGDVDDGDAMGSEAVDGVKEIFGVDLGEGAGGFVHDEDLGRTEKGARDLDHLLLRDGAGVNGRIQGHA